MQLHFLKNVLMGINKIYNIMFNLKFCEFLLYIVTKILTQYNLKSIYCDLYQKHSISIVLIDIFWLCVVYRCDLFTNFISILTSCVACFKPHFTSETHCRSFPLFPITQGSRKCVCPCTYSYSYSYMMYLYRLYCLF